MKKTITSILRNIELETSIEFDFSTLSKPFKVESNNVEATYYRLVYEKDWTVVLLIISTGPNQNQQIGKLNICNLKEVDSNDLFLMASKIKSVIPELPITVGHIVEGKTEYFNL